MVEIKAKAMTHMLTMVVFADFSSPSLEPSPEEEQMEGVSQRA